MMIFIVEGHNKFYAFRSKSLATSYMLKKQKLFTEDSFLQSERNLTKDEKEDLKKRASESFSIKTVHLNSKNDCVKYLNYLSFSFCQEDEFGNLY